MPADKLLRLFIIQAISSFVANDYDSGIHYLREIKQTYAEKMSQLNPTLKNMAKEIIQSLDMFNPGSLGTEVGGDFRVHDEPAATQQMQPSQNPVQQQQPQHQQQNTQPTSVTSELQDLLRRRREKREERE